MFLNTLSEIASFYYRGNYWHKSYFRQSLTSMHAPLKSQQAYLVYCQSIVRYDISRRSGFCLHHRICGKRSRGREMSDSDVPWGLLPRAVSLEVWQEPCKEPFYAPQTDRGIMLFLCTSDWMQLRYPRLETRRTVFWKPKQNPTVNL